MNFLKSAGFPPLRRGRIVCAVPVLLLLAGCPVYEAMPEFRVFQARYMDTQDSAYYQITAYKLAEGTRCIVYADSNVGISAASAKAIAAEYDNRIYPSVSAVFGDYMAAGGDVDGNKKTILFLLDIVDGYTGSGGFVAGYFDPAQLYSVYSYQYSNQADMLFIDVTPQEPESSLFYNTIAHELQHLINHVVHAISGGSSQEIWLNEGLSSAAEYIYSGHRQGRINDFNTDYYNTIAQGNNFFVWNGHWEKEGDTLANYSTAYLFFQWLRIHGGGSSIYSAIAQSKETGYRAVTQAATSRISGITGTEDAKIWEQLLGSWMTANLKNEQTGLYGYKGEITTRVRYLYSSNSLPGAVFSWQLYPGEGIYSNYVQEVANTGNVKYKRIDDPPENNFIDTALLTYNAATDPLGKGEQGSGYNSSTAPAGDTSASGANSTVVNSRSVSPAGSGPPSYPIGIHDLRPRRSAEGDETPAVSPAGLLVPAE